MKFLPSGSYVNIYLRMANENAEDTLRQEDTLAFLDSRQLPLH